MLNLNIVQVENGWKVTSAASERGMIGKQYVFNKAEDLAAFVKEVAIGELPVDTKAVSAG